MREELLRKATVFLERQGFLAFCCEGTHACFDLVARRDMDLYLVKVLENIDAFTQGQARDLKKISFMFGAKGLLLGEASKAGRMEEGVLYERQGVPALSIATFKGVVEGEFPEARKFKVLAVSIDGAKLSETRHEMQFSLEQLASKANISKETLHRYEKEKTGASEENIERLERILNTGLRKPINPFSGGAKPIDEKTVFSFLGFRSVKASSAPFDIAAKERGKLFAGEEADRRTMKKRAKIYAEISEMLESKPCFLLTKSEKDQLEGIPVVRRDELKGIKKARELLKLLEERGE